MGLSLGASSDLARSIINTKVTRSRLVWTLPGHCAVVLYIIHNWWRSLLRSRSCLFLSVQTCATAVLVGMIVLIHDLCMRVLDCRGSDSSDEIHALLDATLVHVPTVR